MTDPDHKAITIVDRAPLQRMHPVVEAMLAQGPDPGTLRELLAVQREWEADEAKKLFTAAMLALKADLPPVLIRDKPVKDRQGNLMYRHTTLAAAMETVDGPLQKHGFTVSWKPQSTLQSVTVVCKLKHLAGHVEETEMTAPPDKGMNRNPVQAIGSTVTYLSRYTLLAMLGIATADMVEPGWTAPGAGDEQIGHPPNVDPEDAVNTARNRNVAAALAEHGKTKAEAEALVGREAERWSKRDLDTIGAWVRASKPALADEPEDLDAAAAASDAAMAGK